MQIRTGTAAVTNGDSTIIASAGNDWSTAVAGAVFGVQGTGVLYQIAADATPPGESDSGRWEIELVAPYASATNATAVYAISVDFTPFAGLPLLNVGDNQTRELFNRAMTTLDGFLEDVGNPLINPMTTYGDTIAGGADGVPVRIAGPVSAVRYVYTTKGNGAVAGQMEPLAATFVLGEMLTQHSQWQSLTVSSGTFTVVCDAKVEEIRNVIAMTADAALAITGAANGYCGMIEVTADAARVLTLPSGSKAPGGDLTVDVSATEKTVLAWYHNGVCLNFAKQQIA